MKYDTLLAEHAAIERLATTLLSLCRGRRRRPDLASPLLERLAELVRDHLAHEDPVIYATVDGVQGSRYASSATASVAAFEALKEDWGQFVYRWDRASVESRWTDFTSESIAMLDRLSERLTMETAILYSLAVHTKVLPTRGTV